MFDAYVNIGSLRGKAGMLMERYPQAKFIITASQDGSSDIRTLDIVQGVSGRNFAVLSAETVNKWKVVCEHLRCPPPVCLFPEIADVGQRRLLDVSAEPSWSPPGRTASAIVRPGW